MEGCQVLRTVVALSRRSAYPSLCVKRGRVHKSSWYSTRSFNSNDNGNTCSIKLWGSQPVTPVTLQSICEIGLNPKKRQQHALFLHRELRIRFAHRVLELQSLPHGLPERQGIRNVIRWYSDFVHDLEAAPEPANARLDSDFTNLLEQIFLEHSEIIQAVAASVQELKSDLGEGEYQLAQPSIDPILRQFFMARIGVRFLLQHHIESFSNRWGHSGILELECDPAIIARKAAADSASLCKAHLGRAPRVIIHESSPGATFAYVPMHIQYMLTEVFKNACRAVVEHHSADEALPAVKCHIVHGNEDITIRISDEGGGIPRNRLSNIWQFMHSTYRGSIPPVNGSKPASADSIANPLQRQRPGRVGVLAGYGVGLTLSRLYAQYFGGNLHMLSIDGFGTDMYLQLNRLGTKHEELPKGVLHSPAGRDSNHNHVRDFQEMLLVSSDEDLFLRQELLNFRAGIRGSVASGPMWSDSAQIHTPLYH